MSPRLQAAIETAYLAGKSTLAHFQAGFELEIKGDNTPVTTADKNAEEIVRQEIQKRFPGDAVLGEEQGMTGTGDTRWVVDPIDGTKSFVCGVPLYATLLSYEVEGEPILGACYIPPLDEMYYAEIGQGAYLNGRPIHVSNKKQLTGSVISTASASRLNDHGHLQGYLNVAKKTLATRTWQDAYGHVLVASGRIEAMVDPTVTRWDISALLPIISEAGGTYSRLDQGNIWENVGNTNRLQLITTNGHVHQELLNDFNV